MERLTWEGIPLVARQSRCSSACHAICPPRLFTAMIVPEGQERVFEMVNNFLIEVWGTIAEQERETIRKRQAEGIEAAKARC